MPRNPHYQHPSSDSGRDAERIPNDMIDGLLERVAGNLYLSVTPEGTRINLFFWPSAGVDNERVVAEGRTCGEAVSILHDRLSGAEAQATREAATRLI